MRYETNSRKLIKRLVEDGWLFIGATGDQHHYKHPSKPGKVTVPHPNKGIAIGTVVSIYWQAGWRTRGKL
jgi:predicted RNA binding protein YcfA (HicA-like mRNA interferase family)